ncbi:MAG TPA: histidine phosphatase family protein [Ignavibacteriales bacterium]|nr:histidine phosphatase family protein [Ignavibacteriales bacterium]HOL80265.1 histidine phosphatase family protein [Ignavibacteriales bacterium]HOM64545.1 histidine phosphatase family protein [Ignavibacteriales bacterium]HPD66642.1 histidine phosphatase family protein [Ignavibacteriales bacterium]HPP32454.1 histidine phosphatase family protein [Ignavibacteriales bacterium]
MNLYFIRHEQAEDIAISRKDFDRNLTNVGIKRIKNSVKFWEYFIKLDIVLSSPYNRALQTAEVIAKHFNVSLKVVEQLGCGVTTNEILDILENYSEYDNIGIVGHEPDISSAISDLTGNGYLRIEIKKGSISKVTFFNKPNLNTGILEFCIPAKAFMKK